MDSTFVSGFGKWRMVHLASLSMSVQAAADSTVNVATTKNVGKMILANHTISYV